LGSAAARIEYSNTEIYFPIALLDARYDLSSAHEGDVQPNKGIFSMQAIWRGRVIAESADTLEVGGYRYFPREAVRMELLRPARKTPSDLECPHGVQFYDLGEAGAQSERAAWSYEAPRASMQQIDHWIGFWEDVEIR
jgi:uncharacterized protein (DUF427 family)